ncbi:MAG TPA: PAS domain S-box protein [Verrucomicrobiae bacterium]|jgi:hypothetical protein|nr:PAS domain S-box protein [Verrucomicrobiae bacterium]
MKTKIESTNGNELLLREIAYRNRAEAALRESERRFSDMMERIQLMSMMLDRNARVTYCNDYLLQITGWDRQEVIGRDWFELFIPPDAKDLRTVFAKLLDDMPDAWHHENEILTKSGERRVVRWDNTVLRCAKGQVIGTASIGKDITARKQAEKALGESNDRLKLISETIDEVFWMTDPATNEVSYISSGYERIWGRPVESLRENSRSFIEAIHEDDRQRVLEVLECKKQGRPFSHEYRIVRPDESVRWISDRGFPVQNLSGEVTHFVGAAQDITERKKLEEQFRQAQKMEAIGQLAGGVAHDFNNILAATMLHAETLVSTEGIPEAVRDGLQQIRGYAERAANLTRQLLLFSRRQVMQICDLDVNESVASLAKMLRRMIGEDVNLLMRLAPTCLVTRADPGMLDQVLMNLAVNARDAMPNGGQIRIETGEQVVDENTARLHSGATPGHHVWLSVTDTGIGMGPEVLQRLFEPFFTTKEPGKGTGLGLATVFGIVKQHRGWIKVQSEPGLGSTFQIFLPASKAACPKLKEAAAPSNCRGQGETILVVEDDPSVQLLIGQILEGHNYRVLKAGNGVEALTLWQKHCGEVALLVTDLIMPGNTNGLELARHLQFDDPQLKVIFTTAYSSAEMADRELRLREGQNSLQKPFRPHVLLDMVRHSLDDRQGGGGLG